MPNPTIHVSTINKNSSDNFIVCIVVFIVFITLDASIEVLPPMTPDADATIDCPTSNTAIVRSNVWLTIHTAIHIFTKYTKNSQNSMSFP